MHDDTLWNADAAPTSAAQRTWRWWHFAALWVGMIAAVPSSMLASALIEQGHVGGAGGDDRVAAPHMARRA